ncbi:MAG: hypothetical protein Tsb0014_38830 [Pleurocapsa sp.]
MNKSFTDRFSDDRPYGKTINTKNAQGVLRTGIDREKAIAIDGNALRFQPLIQPGWGRQGIAYGAYQRADGLAVGVLLLNGHNTSQAETIEWSYQRIPRWLKGSETESVTARIIALLVSQHKQGIVKRLLAWLRMAAEVTKFFPLPAINDNLAVGWFDDTAPSNPVESGNNFIVRATGAENGELLAKVGNNLLSVFQGLQNVPVYYVVILRKKGAAYYAASLPQVYGLPAYPQLRPVAIDALDDQETLYASIHQSVLGQIGFRAYTRVYGIQVETIKELANWYGTAHGADILTGRGNLTTITAAMGGMWQIVTGGFQRSERGLVATENNSLAILDPQDPSGLIHVEIITGDKPATCGIIWRFQDRDNYWCCELKENKLSLQLIEDGKKQEIFSSSEDLLVSNAVSYLQISDDGKELRIYLNGKLIGDRVFRDERLAIATKTGIAISQPNSELYLQNFEAHPRNVTIPSLDLGIAWWSEGKELLIQDNFQGWQGNLTGKTTSIGNKIWEKTIGKGAIEILQPGIAKVQADVNNPNPGRTAYTVPWDRPNFADVEVTIIPPGKERGQGEKGRGGLIFWQDRDNYIIINTWLDDFYEGESISCFFRIAGFEEIYDAVWSNIGRAIAFGQPYTLRVVFDGNNYTVRVNNQTVLYRALTDVYPWTAALNINRLGIVANWEWGDDTGSGFSDFNVYCDR